MRSVPISPRKAPRKYYLDDPLLAEQLAIATAHASLRQLATNAALPTRIRTNAAVAALRCGRLGRDLATEAAARQAEGQADAPR